MANAPTLDIIYFRTIGIISVHVQLEFGAGVNHALWAVTSPSNFEIFFCVKCNFIFSSDILERTILTRTGT